MSDCISVLYVVEVDVIIAFACLLIT